jgi:hypothetical protein
MDGEAFADSNTDSSNVQSETSALVEELRDRVRFLTRASLSRPTSAIGKTGASPRRSATGETQGAYSGLGGGACSVAELLLIGFLGS